jgi:hypothetical protein
MMDVLFGLTLLVTTVVQNIQAMGVTGIAPDLVGIENDDDIKVTGTGFESCASEQCECKLFIGGSNSISANMEVVDDSNGKCLFLGDGKNNTLFASTSTDFPAKGATTKMTVQVFQGDQRYPESESNTGACSALDWENCGVSGKMFVEKNSAVSNVSSDDGTVPGRGAVDSSTLVTLVSADATFLESNDAHCIVGVTNERFIKATYVSSSEYTCDFASIANNADSIVDEQVSYILSMSSSAKGEIKTTATLTFDYVMPPPTILSISSARGGASLIVEWNYPVAAGTGDLVSACDSIWTSETVTKFGTGAKCTWIDNQHVEIILGIDTAVARGGTQTLKVKEDAFRRANANLDSNPYFAAKNQAAAIAPDTVLPEISIVGPTDVHVCGDASDSWLFQPRLEGSVGSKPPQYEWFVNGIQQVSTSFNTIRYDQINKPPGTYTLKVKVTGTTLDASLGALESNISLTITAEQSTPTGYFDVGQSLTMFASDALELHAVILSEGCSPSASAEYKVELTRNIDSEIVETASGTTLLVSEKSLRTGTYKAECIETNSGTVIAKTTILVKASSLSAEIAGGSSRLVNENVPMNFVAQWPDPDQTQTTATGNHVDYTWSCPKCGASIDNLDTTKKSLEGLILGEDTYELLLTVKVGSRVDSTSTSLVVRPTAINSAEGPVIGLYLKDGSLSGTSDIIFETSFLQPTKPLAAGSTFVFASIASDGVANPLDLAQASNSTNSYSLDANINGAYLGVQPFSLSFVLNGGVSGPQPGFTYLFRASSFAGSVETSYAEIEITVPYPPSNVGDVDSDRITVVRSSNPNKGAPLKTSYQVSAVGFTSQHLIRYTYVMKFADGSIVTVHKSAASTTPGGGLRLPAGVTHLGVKASDQNGETGWSWAKVDLEDTSPTHQQAVLAEFSDVASSAAFFGQDYQLLVALVIDLAVSGTEADKMLAFGYLEQAGVALMRTFEASSLRLDLIMQGVAAVQHHASRTSADVKKAAGSVLAVFSLGLTPEYSGAIEAEALLSALGVVASPADINAIDSVNSDTRVMDIAVVLDAVKSSLCASMVYGQPAREFGSLQDFVRATTVRSPVKSLVTPGIDGAKVYVQNSILDEVKRKDACSTALASADMDNAATNCLGGCLVVMQVAGNLRGNTSSGSYAIPATILSDSVTLYFEGPGVSRRHARAATATSITSSVASVTCDDQTTDCLQCRKWDTNKGVWVEDEKAIIVQGTDVTCTTDVVGDAASTNVAVFKSCSPGKVGRGCVTDCPAFTYGQDCAGKEDCNGMLLNQVDGTCTCVAGFTGNKCEYQCDTVLTYAGTVLPDAMEQGFGVECDVPCTCNAVGSSTCDIYSGICTCNPGYEGVDCSTNIDDCVDASGEPSCKNNGVCTDQVLGFACDCRLTGKGGTTCETKTEYCDKKEGACLNDAVCVDQLFNLTCNCTTGMTGSFCESYCPDGSWGDGCAAKCTCDEHGVCNSVDGSCDCDIGWSGLNCDTAPAVKTKRNYIVIIVPVVMVLLAIVILLLYFYKRSKNRNKTKAFQGLNAGNFEAAASGIASASAVKPGEVGFMKVQKGQQVELNIGVSFKEATITSEMTLAMLRDKLCDIAPDVFGRPSFSSTGKFYFEKPDGSGPYISTHELTLFVKKCYLEGDPISVSFVEYADAVLLEFCICGRVSVFECSVCSLQGYCSEACQRGDWKIHRSACKTLLAGQAAKTEALAIKLSRASISAPAVEADQAASSKGSAPADTGASATATNLETCAVCGTSSEFECSSCGMVGYCSKKCQRADWQSHKILCKAAIKAKELAPAGADAGAGGGAGASVAKGPEKSEIIATPSSATSAASSAAEKTLEKTEVSPSEPVVVPSADEALPAETALTLTTEPADISPPPAAAPEAAKAAELVPEEAAEKEVVVAPALLPVMEPVPTPIAEEPAAAELPAPTPTTVDEGGGGQLDEDGETAAPTATAAEESALSLLSKEDEPAAAEPAPTTFDEGGWGQMDADGETAAAPAPAFDEGGWGQLDEDGETAA